MPIEFKVLSNKGASRTYKKMTPEEKLKHFRNVAASVTQNAQGAWADIWNEFQDTVTRGVVISPEAEKGNFKPKCGWPEFLEKMWLLKHNLDYLQRFSQGKE